VDSLATSTLVDTCDVVHWASAKSVCKQ